MQASCTHIDPGRLPCQQPAHNTFPFMNTVNDVSECYEFSGTDLMTCTLKVLRIYMHFQRSSPFSWDRAWKLKNFKKFLKEMPCFTHKMFYLVWHSSNIHYIELAMKILYTFWGLYILKSNLISISCGYIQNGIGLFDHKHGFHY